MNREKYLITLRVCSQFVFYFLFRLKQFAFIGRDFALVYILCFKDLRNSSTEAEVKVKLSLCLLN